MKKIPDHAKKVFEGIIFDVYHWDQQMFDGSTTTFEAIKKLDSVTILAVVENKIIINDEEQPGKPPFIAFPGGMGDRGEEPLTSAKRELLEETGLESNDWTLWSTVDPLKLSKMEWNNFIYIAKDCKRTTEPRLDPGERIVSRYLSFEELLELRNVPTMRNKDIIPVLEKAANDESEKQKLKDLLGII
jgi:ADP-ribose pyrophosphatase